MQPDIGKIIRFHRKQSGLSQLALANLAGVGKTVVYDLEKGKESVQLDTLLRVLGALNIRIRLESPLMPLYEEPEDEES